ncbi:auxin efflux carrier [Nitratireductor pacificus pht-3B]|uniref:Auxin efflux carrier n=1 Tax=Nitratireductor pacificus pht-3B TaxID=391937 RepID=K2MC07_9HYPH|nr:auxin efflux carrier [Nitratireductor pacificus pht-3B]
MVETVSFVFGLVAFGYLAGWIGLLKPQVGDALTDFAISVAVPLLLFRTMAGAGFDGHVPWHLWIAYFSAIAVAWIAGQLIITRVFGRDARAGVVAGLSTSFSNLVLLGIPFMLGVYGQSGFEILSLIISIHLPIMMGMSILLFALVGRSGNGGFLQLAREFVVNLFSSPLIIGILAGLAWRFSGLEMPALGTRFVDALANIAGPTALFAMGLGLRKFGISGDIRPALVIAGLKLFLMPAVALAMAKMLGLPLLSAQVVVAAASLPSGVNPYLIANRFGTGQALASNSMTIGTLFAVVTTAFWLSAVHWVYP